MVNICLCGLGAMGKLHLANILNHPSAQVAAVVDPQPVDYALPCKHYDTVEQALDKHPDIDALVIASPTPTHVAAIITAAQRGIAVLCEKPIAMTAEEAEHAVEVTKKHNTTLCVGFNRRFDAAFETVYDGIQSGEIGDVEVLRITSRDPHPPDLQYLKRSGGLFYDMMIHDFDMARWLLGEEPVEVTALASCLVDPRIRQEGDVDTAVVLLRTASGKLCHIHNSRRSIEGYDQRVEAFGAKGVIRTSNLPLQISNEPFFVARYREAYRKELDHFIDVLRGVTTPRTSGTDGLKAQRLAEAAARSLHEGSRVLVSDHTHIH